MFNSMWSYAHPKQRSSLYYLSVSLISLNSILHPPIPLVALLSKGPDKCSNDIGNRKVGTKRLASIKRAAQSFNIFIEYKNLKYLKTAKRLNPHQACWAIFFYRFHFTLSFPSGSKNTNVNAGINVKLNFLKNKKTLKGQQHHDLTLCVNKFT